MSRLKTDPRYRHQTEDDGEIDPVGRIATDRNLIEPDAIKSNMKFNEMQAGLDLGFERTLANTIPKIETEIFQGETNLNSDGNDQKN